LTLNAQPDSLVTMRSGGVPMYRGRLGQRNNKIAIKIEGRIQPKEGT
jgi:flagellar motor switch protein FliM